ncbi:MAG: PQQ-binding-like beta-propeller repeat protein, partial [Candidatus Poribacteria bacterium]|nr:PQQ-binding-like beta-propeller repeat protein [Candidatus Poribacteria bacterium]
MKDENLRLCISIALIVCIAGLVRSAYGAEIQHDDITFTRQGVVIEARNEPTLRIQAQIQSDAGLVPVEVLPIDGDRLFLQFSWQPATAYEIRLDSLNLEGRHVSPLKPSVYRVRMIELDSLLSLLANLKRPAVPTTVAFSPDGSKLAIATDAGHLAILDPLTGKDIWSTRISEGYAKHTTFGPDGTLFYIGEQSAEGLIYAYKLSKKEPELAWTYRTADDIDTSRPVNPDDVYGWVQYPGPYRMAMTADGDLLASANHSWTEDGKNLKKAQFYCFDGATGEVKWKWPSDRALPMIIKWFDYSKDGKTVALVCDGGATDGSSRYSSGTLYVLEGESGADRWNHTFDSLKPYYGAVTFWRGVAVSPDGSWINVSTDDGRVFIFDSAGTDRHWKTDLTTPLKVSDVPVTATAGTIGATNEIAVFVTGDTYIPYHLKKGAQQPPSAHPNGMTFFAYSWTGEKRWQWKLENMPQALRINARGKYAVVSQSKYNRSNVQQLHGVSVYNLKEEGGGLEKYLYTYRTEGMLPYDTIDISADGRLIAVVETPIVMPDETVRGKN